jgi:predicted acylesterase/phospholipase RssA
MSAEEKNSVSIPANKYGSDLLSKSYTGLCLGVGGMKGLLLLGALYVFWQNDQLKALTHLSGSSVGSMIVALLAIGYNPLEMLVAICDTYFTNQFSVLNWRNIGTIMGLFPHSILRTKLEGMFIDKLGYLPTFKQLAENLNKHLIIASYCLSDPDPKMSKVYFSWETTPNMPVIEAIILSCSVPGVFQQAKYDGKVWTDGACNSMFPIRALQSTLPANTPILGLYLGSNTVDLNDPLGYLYALMSFPFRDQDNLSGLGEAVNYISIKGTESSGSLMSSINFARGASQKINMFIHGAQQVYGIFKNLRDKTILSDENHLII